MSKLWSGPNTTGARQRYRKACYARHPTLKITTKVGQIFRFCFKALTCLIATLLQLRRAAGGRRRDGPGGRLADAGAVLQEAARGGRVPHAVRGRPRNIHLHGLLHGHSGETGVAPRPAGRHGPGRDGLLRRRALPAGVAVPPAAPRHLAPQGAAQARQAQEGPAPAAAAPHRHGAAALAGREAARGRVGRRGHRPLHAGLPPGLPGGQGGRPRGRRAAAADHPGAGRRPGLLRGGGRDGEAQRPVPRVAAEPRADLHAGCSAVPAGAGLGLRVPRLRAGHVAVRHQPGRYALLPQDVHHGAGARALLLAHVGLRAGRAGRARAPGGGHHRLHQREQPALRLLLLAGLHAGGRRPGAPVGVARHRHEQRDGRLRPVRLPPAGGWAGPAAARGGRPAAGAHRTRPGGGAAGRPPAPLPPARPPPERHVRGALAVPPVPARVRPPAAHHAAQGDQVRAGGTVPAAGQARDGHRADHHVRVTTADEDEVHNTPQRRRNDVLRMDNLGLCRLTLAGLGGAVKPREDRSYLGQTEFYGEREVLWKKRTCCERIGLQINWCQAVPKCRSHVICKETGYLDLSFLHSTIDVAYVIYRKNLDVKYL